MAAAMATEPGENLSKMSCDFQRRFVSATQTPSLKLGASVQEPDLNGLSYYHDHKPETEVVAGLLGDVPHFWAGDEDLLIDHLFTRTKVYECSVGYEFVGGTIDVAGYAARLAGHRHTVAIEYKHRWAAYDWVIENVPRGLTVIRPDTVGAHPDDLSSFSWLIVETAGLGLCLTGQISGWIGRDPPQVFFFKDEEKAALFKLFASEWLET